MYEDHTARQLQHEQAILQGIEGDLARLSTKVTEAGAHVDADLSDIINGLTDALSDASAMVNATERAEGEMEARCVRMHETLERMALG